MVGPGMATGRLDVSKIGYQYSDWRNKPQHTCSPLLQLHMQSTAAIVYLQREIMLYK